MALTANIGKRIEIDMLQKKANIPYSTLKITKFNRYLLNIYEACR